jgi:MoxR-like ATPase
MQESSVTTGGTTHKMKQPYFVMATQNPLEQEGTYPLPEAQLDRFMFSLRVDYPSFNEEVEIVKRTNSGSFKRAINVISKDDILAIRRLLPEIPITDNIFEYAVNLVRSSRPDQTDSPQFIKESVRWGAGPRAGQSLITAAKISAVLNGSISPEKKDVNRVAKQVLRHRILPSFKAEAEGMTPDMIIEELIKHFS